MPLLTLGTVNVTEVSDHDFMEAAVEPNITVPLEFPNPLPAMVTVIPGWPTVGPMDPTSGAVGVPTDCQTATVCAGKVKLLAGLLPPLPAVTVRLDPPRSPVK